jgi:hypothetical protein
LMPRLMPIKSKQSFSTMKFKCTVTHMRK